MKSGKKNLWWDAGTADTFRAMQPSLPSPLVPVEVFACYFFSAPLFSGFLVRLACCSLVSKAFCWDSSTLWGDSSSKTKHSPGPSLCRGWCPGKPMPILCACASGIVPCLSLSHPVFSLWVIYSIPSPVVPSYFAKQVPRSSQHLIPLRTQHPSQWKWWMKPKFTLASGSCQSVMQCFVTLSCWFI